MAQRMTAREWMQIIEALAALVVARVGLRFWQLLPLSRLNLGRVRSGERSNAEGIARSVERASRLLPGTVCLPRALATQWMLRRRGVETTLHVGVSRTIEHGFESHAWITYDERVLIGGENSPARYREILRLGLL